MPWRIDWHPEARRWFEGLPPRQAEMIAPAIDALAESGPRTGMPHVKRIKGSRHHNMKELRSTGGNLRVLFAMDPNRRAVLLVGGDKTNQWRQWYDRNITLADARFDERLRRLGKEPAWRVIRAGTRSAERQR